MKFRHPYRELLSLLIVSGVAACGGGGSSAPASGGTPAAVAPPPVTPPVVTPPPPPPPPPLPPPPVVPPATIPPAVTTGATTMSCVDGAGYQCSGRTILRTDNGIALTSSGVQAYGKSTNDLVNPIADPTTSKGLALASGGVAEIRIAKNSATGAISSPAILLSNLGISWDGVKERPPIIETFRTDSGRVQLEADGKLTFASLPDSANLGYFDFASKGIAATQLNYANNRYFPRVANPSRCTIGTIPDIETLGLTTGPTSLPSDWRTGGIVPDNLQAIRVHADGDVRAGDKGVDPATGTPTYFSGSVGKSVPCAGTKGERTYANWGLQYGNLSTWLSKDTVNIAEWGSNEHNQNRRGVVAFGAVSDPASVPVTGTATYSGFVTGWTTLNATDEATLFRGEATVTVNFATRQAVVSVKNTAGYDPVKETYSLTLSLPVIASTAMGAAGSNVANYLTGTADSNGMKGGLSGRYFGPVITTGISGAGPAELGGAFSLSEATSGKTVVAGFIGRKL